MRCSKNQSGLGDGLGPRTDPRPVKRSLAITTAIFSAITGAGVLLFVGARSQARVINCPFADVVSYFSGAFNADLTQTGKHTMAWGPKFLDNWDAIFRGTSCLLTDQELRFRAWYYQIGGKTTRSSYEDSTTDKQKSLLIRSSVSLPSSEMHRKRTKNF